MGTVRFVLRTDKPDQNGLCPIRLLYQISGKVKYFKTNEKLRPQHWDTKNQEGIHLDQKKAKKLFPEVAFRLLPTATEIDDLNLELAGLRGTIKNIEKKFELDNVPYSVEMVVKALGDKKTKTTKTEAPSNQVFDFIDKYIEDNKATREPGSMSVYKSLKTHLQDFEAEKKKKITFDKIDYSFFLEFQNFLISPRTKFVQSKKKDGTGKGAWKNITLGNVTIAKQLSTLKTFLNYARVHGFEVSNKYKDFTIKKENLEVIALTNDEFEKLYSFDLSGNKKLDQVRDVFCFSCATGLRYSDLAQLKQEHIKEHEIKITVTKTKQPLTIPLNPYSFAILEKYKDRLHPLPVISNAKMNLYLKELCQLAEINDPLQIVRFKGSKREETLYPKHELISVHTGRKTFCTLSLEKGMSAEQVMKISGHKDYASFSRYVKVTEQLTKAVMRNTWGEIKRPVMKAV